MKEITRTPEPDWWLEKADVWRERWEQRRSLGQQFSWYEHKGKGSKDLARRLSDMTKQHCSFCDSHPMGSMMKPFLTQVFLKRLNPE